jgi:membrane protease YdiL (CAAX protease family)
MTNNILYTRETRRVRYIFKLISFVAFAYAGLKILPHLPFADNFSFEYMALGLVALSLLLVREFEKRPAATLGLAWNTFTTRQFLGGLLLGTLMISFVVTGMRILGYADFTLVIHTWNESVRACAPQLLFFLCAAAVEELVFRGYLYQTAIESSNTTVATIIFSLLFAVAHGANPGIGVLAYTNIFLAGLLFAGAYLRTRQLWLPITIHAAWNFFQGTIYGAEVSGESIGQHLFSMRSDGPAWITGGAFGPEAGVLTTVALLIGIVAVNAFPVFQISPEQYALSHRVRYGEDRALIFSDEHTG